MFLQPTHSSHDPILARQFLSLTVGGRNHVSSLGRHLYRICRITGGTRNAFRAPRLPCDRQFGRIKPPLILTSNDPRVTRLMSPPFRLV